MRRLGWPAPTGVLAADLLARARFGVDGAGSWRCSAASSLSESRETVGSSQGSLSESQESILSVEGVHDEVPLPTKETDTETLLELYRTQLEMVRTLRCARCGRPSGPIVSPRRLSAVGRWRGARQATQATSHLEERLKQLVFERDLRPLDDRIQRVRLHPISLEPFRARGSVGSSRAACQGGPDRTSSRKCESGERKFASWS